MGVAGARTGVPRALRPQEAGGWFHLTARAVRREPLFEDDRDRCRFLLDLRDVVADMDWRCLAFCLMTTHYHLLVRTQQANLGAGMQQLNGRYARSFNGRHGRRGHAFGDRYGCEPIRRDAHLLETLRYIALNPVRAGLVDRPDAWRWSSHRTVLQARQTETWVAVGEVLALFGTGGTPSRRRYAVFVGEGVPQRGGA